MESRNPRGCQGVPRTHVHICWYIDGSHHSTNVPVVPMPPYIGKLDFCRDGAYPALVR
jgi:hypothetical protein